MNDNQKKRLLKVARDAALKAGEMLFRHKDSPKAVNLETGHDIKLGADVAAETLIVKHLQKFSDYPILSEEKGSIQGKSDKAVWIVDPLDGSMNYFRGIPLCCVSIGLWENDKPVLGVVYDFTRPELFYGIVGKGAWLNAKPIKASSTAKKDKAVLCTGFPSKTDFSRKGLSDFVDRAGAYKKIRMLGAAALMLVYVAAGRTDVYEERDTMIWDVAGALAVLKAAGGSFTMKKAKKEHSFDVYASNAKLT